jgi:hypothetical protein
MTGLSNVLIGVTLDAVAMFIPLVRYAPKWDYLGLWRMVFNANLQI